MTPITSRANRHDASCKLRTLYDAKSTAFSLRATLLPTARPSLTAEGAKMSLHHFARGAIAAENSRRAMMLRGFTPNGHPLWDQAEARNLRLGYPDYASVLLLNVRRTRPAHYGKAGRLGITRPGGRPWTDNEILRLRRLFVRASRAQILEALPERSWDAVASKAYGMGLSRPVKALKPTGSVLLDQIRLRAQQRGITMRELDGFTCGAGYFAKAKWRNGKVAPAILTRAVSVLGGRLRFRLHA